MDTMPVSTFTHWRVYNTFIHIDAPSIGVRRVQSAPGDWSFDRTAVAAKPLKRLVHLGPAEAEDDLQQLDDRSRGQAAEDENDAAVTEQTIPTMSRAQLNYCSRNRKRRTAAAIRGREATTAPPPLPPPPVPPQQLHDCSRGQALKRLRQTCLHSLPRKPLWLYPVAATPATCGSATYHASTVHPQAQQWRSGRPSWLKEKSTMARVRTLCLEYQWDQWGATMPGIEMHDIESDWHECRHCGEDILVAWKQCSLCGTRQ